jgi:hypothetical protein
MAFGLMGGAAAWLAHLLVNFALASEACSPGTPGVTPDALSELHLTMVVNGVAAMFIAALATWVAYANWRATREEEHGDHEHLLEIGEGRTRFLSILGMVLSGGFLAATVFDTLALLMVPLCS